MTRYLLDTNIVSEAVKPAPSPRLADWMSRQRDADLFIAALTVAEIHRGILEKPPGRRRADLESWFGGPEGPSALFAGRILSFDEAAAMVWGRLMADGKAIGRPRSALDTIIAATAIANDCVVVTANARDFSGVDMLNPMAGP